MIFPWPFGVMRGDWLENVGYNEFNMTQEYCPHCLPTKRKNHATQHLEFYLEKLTSPFKSITKTLDHFLSSGTGNRLRGSLFELLALIGVIKFNSNIDETKFHNRSLIFFKEAKRRGLDIRAIKFLGNYINEFRFTYNGKKYYYEAIPLTIKGTAAEWDDKYLLKKLLMKNNLPVAQGRAFTNIRKAMIYGKTLGYPLIVKPISGSLSYHCTCSIQTEKELAEAIGIVKQYRPDFVIEQHIEGNLYRATVVGQTKVFVCQKERANVVGDGLLTVQELIDKKNNHPDRGEAHQRNTSLHKIVVDSVLERNLEKEDLTLHSVPKIDRLVYLQDKFVLGLGCDIINVTSIIDSANHELFVKLSKLLGAHVLGIDFICSDISQPYTKQQAAILEVNSLPYIDMHQYPSGGYPEPVSEIVWDLTLKNFD